MKPKISKIKNLSKEEKSKLLKLYVAMAISAITSLIIVTMFSINYFTNFLNILSGNEVTYINFLISSLTLFITAGIEIFLFFKTKGDSNYPVRSIKRSLSKILELEKETDIKKKEVIRSEFKKFVLESSALIFKSMDLVNRHTELTKDNYVFEMVENKISSYKLTLFKENILLTSKPFWSLDKDVVDSKLVTEIVEDNIKTLEEYNKEYILPKKIITEWVDEFVSILCKEDTRYVEVAKLYLVNYINNFIAFRRDLYNNSLSEKRVTSFDTVDFNSDQRTRESNPDYLIQEVSSQVDYVKAINLVLPEILSI